MQNKQHNFWDDLAKMASSAGAAMMEWRKEVEKIFHSQIEKWGEKMDFVPRSEFEIVREMAAANKIALEELQKKLTSLETQISPTTGSGAKKTTTRKKTGKTSSSAKKDATTSKTSTKKTSRTKSNTKKAATNE